MAGKEILYIEYEIACAELFDVPRTQYRSESISLSMHASRAPY